MQKTTQNVNALDDLKSLPKGHWLRVESDGDDGDDGYFEDDGDEELDLTRPIDISKVDLTMPPDFAGRLTMLIRSQCKYPRHNIAAAAGFYSLGCISGLRYRDDFSGVTSNFMIFGLGDTGTGKDNILDMITEICARAGMDRVTYGKIKSFQEIIRNLLHHQPANYALDEVSHLFGMIAAAKKSGSAPYLDGIIGEILTISTKAGSSLKLGGDTARELEKEMLTVIARYEKQMDAESDPAKCRRIEGRLASAEKLLKMAVNGRIERPFLSLFGFSVPDEFRKHMNAGAARSGLLGRSLLVEDSDYHPDPNEYGPFHRPPISDAMDIAIKEVSIGHKYDVITDQFPDRVENYGERIMVKTPPEIWDLLIAIEKYWRNIGKSIIRQSNAAVALKPIIGVLRRSNEQMLKIVFTLATGTADHVKTVEHVAWALAFVERDFSQKYSMLFAEVNNDDISGNLAKDSNKAKIKSALPSYRDMVKGKRVPGRTVSEIAAGISGRTYSSLCDILPPILEEMERDGVVVSESGRMYKGVIKKKWWLA